MKKTIAVLALLTMVLMVGFAQAESFTIKASWKQANLENVGGWTLYWSDTSGGPYEPVIDTENRLVRIAYQAPADVYATQHVVAVEGEMGSTVTKYFAIKTYAASDSGIESAFSEEAAASVFIPHTIPGTPFEFMIQVTTD